MDQIRPIKTDADYEAALAEIERLFDAVPDTPESDVLEVLVTLVEAYESKHYSIPLPDPTEAIMYHMESRGLSRRDVEPFISRHAWIIQALTEAVAPPDFEAGLVLGFTEPPHRQRHEMLARLRQLPTLPLEMRFRCLQPSVGQNPPTRALSPAPLPQLWILDDRRTQHTV